MSSRRAWGRLRAACVLSSMLAPWLSPAPGHAQEGLQSASSALRDAALAALAESAPDEGPTAVVVRPELPEGAPDASGLAAALAAPLLEALAADPRRAPARLAALEVREGETLAAVARGLGDATLVTVTARVRGADLLVEGAVVRTRDEVRAPIAAARVPLDASLRAFVGYPPRLTDETVSARSLALPGRGYVALAIGDLDGDGRAELVAARTDEVHVLRVRGRRLELVGRVAVPASVPRAPTVSRRPMGSAIVRGERAAVRTSEHAVGLAVRLASGRPVIELAEGPCPADRYPMLGGCARAVTGRDFFDPELDPRESPAPAAPAHFYAYAFASYAAPDGTRTSYEVIVMPSGRVSLRVLVPRERPRGPSFDERAAAASGYGTALAMGDLDLDGAAEILVSQAALAGQGDQLTLLRALPRGALRTMWRSPPLAGSVWTAAAGDADGDGLPELAAIEEPTDPAGRATLWLVR
ncbi:MAG: hypothetical protein KF729_06370 [Sandaracinaceae bacterium]|nr:hypothetical protein [Sandaracinaceae bacterium]